MQQIRQHIQPRREAVGLSCEIYDIAVYSKISLLEADSLKTSHHLYIALLRLALPVSRLCTKECPMGYDSRPGPAQFAGEGAPNMQKTSPLYKNIGARQKMAVVAPT